jgi:hypothetical protein
MLQLDLRITAWPRGVKGTVQALKVVSGRCWPFMETAREAPSLDISTISEELGLDYLESVRLEPRRRGNDWAAPPV